MGTFYRADKELSNYLVTDLGFTFHDRNEPEVEYYTEHKTGKQVKIDTVKNLVTLLDNTGKVVDSSSSFTDNQILNFLNN